MINGIKTLAASFWRAGAEAAQIPEEDRDEEIRKIGFTVIGLVFGVFGLWAALAPLDMAASAIGQVEVKGKSQYVQHLEGGILKEVLVENGTHVDVAQPLLVLDNTKSLAEQDIVAGRIWAESALVDRLLAERDELESIVFRESLAQSMDERAVVAMQNENALFSARQATVRGQIELSTQKKIQLVSQIDGLEAVINAKRSISDSLKTEIIELQSLLADGYVDKVRIREMERSVTESLGEIADLEATLSASKVAMVEIDLSIAQYKKEYKTTVVNELKESEEALYDLTQQHKAIADRVVRSVVRAPIAGAVMAVKFNTPGAVIAPGQKLLAVVPDATALVVSAKLSPLDIDLISVGQQAEIRFAVFKDAYVITGELVKVSADVIVDENTGEQFYAAEIHIPDGELRLLGDYKLVPGMPAQVLIKTGTRTLLSYLTSPLRRAFSNSLIEQ